MATRIYTDVQLDRWAEIYLTNSLLRAGVSFGRFIGQADLLFARMFGPFATALPTEPETELDDFLPLTPRQARAQREADLQETINDIAAKREAALARDCGQSLCHKGRRSADVRVSDGRLTQSMHPKSVTSRSAAGGHR